MVIWYTYKGRDYVDMSFKVLVWRGGTWKKVTDKKLIKELNKHRALRKL